MKLIGIGLMAAALCGCTTMGHKSGESFPVSEGSVQPGTKVKVQGQDVGLYKTGTIKEGDDFKPLLKLVDLTPPHAVTVVNVVPSIDTPVCEQQTHILGESAKLDPRVARVVISRDTAMAQKRFAKEAGLENVAYGSDFKHGEFGKKTGLLMKGPELLARAVLVLDGDGKVQYLQVVPNVATLPDMDKAFQVANKLVKSE